MFTNLKTFLLKYENYFCFGFKWEIKGKLFQHIKYPHCNNVYDTVKIC